MSKMLVRLLVSRAGVNFSQSRGDEIEIDSAEGERMLAAHQCTFISGERGTISVVDELGADGDGAPTDDVLTAQGISDDNSSVAVEASTDGGTPDAAEAPGATDDASSQPSGKKKS